MHKRRKDNKLHWENRLKKMNPTQKEAFYTRLTAVRRNKLVKLSEAQNHRCCYCGRDTFLGEQVPKGYTINDRATLEHVVPQTKGGRDSFWDTVMACNDCNNRRGSKIDAEEFYYIMSNPTRKARFLYRFVKEKKKTPEAVESQNNRTVVMAFYLAYLFHFGRIEVDYEAFLLKA